MWILFVKVVSIEAVNTGTNLIEVTTFNCIYIHIILFYSKLLSSLARVPVST